MTTLYIAGPMRGVPEFNFPAFFAAEDKLRAAGYDTINPARRDLEKGFDPSGMDGLENLAIHGFDLLAALAWDCQQICMKADGLALLPGWKASRGARAERALAIALGLRLHSVEWWVYDAPGSHA